MWFCVLLVVVGVWVVLFVGCYLLLFVLFGLVVDSVVLFFLLFRYVCFRVRCYCLLCCCLWFCLVWPCMLCVDRWRGVVCLSL